MLAHPMVVHYGCPPAKMRLQRAHRAVEGGHRHDAWEMVLSNTPPALEDVVVAAFEEALTAWMAYRDGVARAIGVTWDR